MEGSDVASVIADSALAVYDYFDLMQFATDPPLGMSVTNVSSCDVRDGYAVLHLDSPLTDTGGIMLMVGDSVINEESAGFTRYDEISRTIVSRPGDEILTRIVAGERVRILNDMKFLITAVGEFYRKYGGYLTLPLSDPSYGIPVFPAGSEPTVQQMEAVECVLSNRMSYIWGAPGTGKTQFVLATCIRACLSAGRKVAVFAPTNNSVEQVLSGLLKAFGGEEWITDRIIRLGVPSNEFYRQHPEMCEDRQAQRKLDSALESLDNLSEVMFERCADALQEEVCALSEDAEIVEEDDHGRVMLRNYKPLKKRFVDLSGLLGMYPETRDIVASASERDFRHVMRDVVSSLYSRPRPALDLDEFEDWSDVDLMASIIEVEIEVRRLRLDGTGDRMSKARIVAATPQQFISRFRPRGSEQDSRMELDVDHIFLDEAGYCGLIQAASLFTNGVPVTFLGDHMQLPPVSQIDDCLARAATEKGGRLKDAYLWGMSALHCEGLLTGGPVSLKDRYLSSSDPEMVLTKRRNLTESRRFGANLGRVLDCFVYRNGMSGSSGSDLEIICIDTTCEQREGRENIGEMLAIREFLRSEKPDPHNIAILTPYAVHGKLLRKGLGKAYRDCVSTVHGSQGREWDTVILSVADNRVKSRDVHLRFTSSETDIGLKVINTAVSRAKRRLVIVCDREFWMEKDGELIGGLLREVPEDKVFRYGRPRS